MKLNNLKKIENAKIKSMLESEFLIMDWEILHLEDPEESSGEQVSIPELLKFLDRKRS